MTQVLFYLQLHTPWNDCRYKFLKIWKLVLFFDFSVSADIIKTVPDSDGRLIADIRRATSHIESEPMRRTMRTSWIFIIAVEETRKRGRGRGSKLHDRDGKITEREGE